MKLANADKLFPTPALCKKLEADSASVQEDGDFIVIRATKGKKSRSLRLTKAEVLSALENFYLMEIDAKLARLKAEIA